ncbi:MAG: 23S rRNA (uracil(1939)-C(5))-methyltransferase RlmD, partial [Lachnospiraceae bacterium]|nr:23S rRNA (uracil(1939)-C(5))-methyltransferase RlmD [Lachnospiraceae bacterium]
TENETEGTELFVTPPLSTVLGEASQIGVTKRTVPVVTSLSLNINNKKTNVILGDKVINLWGEDVIHDVIGGIDFAISPLSFFQVNPVQMEKLYATALEYAGLTGQEAVWDLYCGIGSISLFMAKKARVVYGVEVIPQAIGDAGDNAKRNGIDNVKFFVGKAEEVLPEFYQDKNESPDMKHPDVIVVDPPRKGCDEACLETMLKMQPDRIVYVSCDPATLARDLKILTEGGYELKRVRPCDMFPQSVHIETACLLKKRS